MGVTRKEFEALVYELYGVRADYPFEKDFETAVFRHSENKKWFALSMTVPYVKFGIDKEGNAEVVNLKIPPEMFGSFSEGEGVYPAYHMNKAHWVSVLIESADFETVDFLLNASFFVTKPSKKKK